MSKMDVLVISNMYPSSKNVSFGIFVKNQVEALRGKGLNIDVLAIDDHRMERKYVVKKYLKWLFYFFFKVGFSRKKYDIIHAHYVFPSGLLGLWYKKLKGGKLVVTAHGGDIDKMANKSPFFNKQTEKILHNADTIIAVGEKLRDDIVAKFKVNQEKIHVINMGVNRSTFKPMEKNLVRKKLNLGSNKFVILFVGNLIKAKGVFELVKSFEQLKQLYSDMELHLIGANKEPQFLGTMSDYIERQNISDIYFHPPMHQSDIAEWMSAADCFVLPSHMEGFGLVALEAMACHTPVVASDVGGLSYLVKNGAGLLIQPKDINSLKSAIEKIYLQFSLRDELIEAGEKVAAENDANRQVEKLIKIYRNLLV